VAESMVDSPAVGALMVGAPVVDSPTVG